MPNWCYCFNVSLDGIILCNVVKYWALVTLRLGLHKVKWANSKMAYTSCSVSTLDSGIQLSTQINPYADNLWRLLTSLYTNPVLKVHFIDISASQFMAQSIPSVPITPGHLSSCRSLRRGFVRKPLPGRGTFFNFSRRG